MEIPRLRSSADSRIRDYPCAYTLAYGGDWNAVPAVLKHLQEERTTQDLLWSAEVLRHQLERALAAAAVNEQLKSATTELHRENLRKVLKYIQQE